MDGTVCAGSRAEVRGSARPEHPCLQAVAPLMKYLDEKLALLNSSLVKGNLSRCGQVGWDGLARGH